MKEPCLEGVVVPLLTPFDAAGPVNGAMLGALIDRLVDAGVHGLFAAGTTGEGPLLSEAERRLVAETAVRAARGRVPVLVQAGTLTTEASIAAVRHARACGAAAAAVLCPYYFRLPDEALVDHFCTIAASVPDYPIVLYNIPQLTGNSISPAITSAVARRCANVVGEKDSGSDLNAIVAKRRTRDGDFQVLIGNEGLILPGLVSGIRASVSGSANIWPELFVALFDAFREGDLRKAQSLQEHIDRLRALLRDGADISLLKGLLGFRGIAAGPVRPPLPMCRPEEVAACQAELAALQERRRDSRREGTVGTEVEGRKL